MSKERTRPNQFRGCGSWGDGRIRCFNGRIGGIGGGGTITQGIGVKIPEIDGAANNRWGIYDSSGDSEYFAGNVGIGTARPVHPLQVAGIIAQRFRKPGVASLAAC
jgi:hypothetical protein